MRSLQYHGERCTPEIIETDILWYVLGKQKVKQLTSVAPLGLGKLEEVSYAVLIYSDPRSQIYHRGED
jgi:hypothetical protein